MRESGLHRLWFVGAFALLFCASVQAASAGNCALWARAETGVALYGAAAGWWGEAEGRYQRGQKPTVGAILVFERSRHMPSGHVAVVSQVVGPREILVDQSNWYRGATTRGDSVIDTSPSNDWSSVAVLDRRSGEHGRDNPAYGFIYPQAAPTNADIYVGEKQPAAEGLVHLAVAHDDEPLEVETHSYWRGRRHHAVHAADHHKRTTAHAAHHTAPHHLAHHAAARHERHRA